MVRILFTSFVLTSTIMNALKGLFGKVASKIPGAAGGIPKGGGSGLVVIAGLGLGTYGLYNSMVTIQPGHKGVIYNRIGGLDEIAGLKEGLNFVIPWFQRAVVFDCRTRPQPIDTHSGSKGNSHLLVGVIYIYKLQFFIFVSLDLQMVQISLRVLFKPDPDALPFIYRRLGKDFDARVLPSIVNEVTKAVVAQYNASELLTKRDLVSRQIREMLMKRAGDFKILLDDVSITHLAFSTQYTAAVEAKQVAQQESERAKYIVERALQEKKSIIIKAEGEATSAQLIGNVCFSILDFVVKKLSFFFFTKAIQNNPAFIQLRRIEAAKDVCNLLFWFLYVN